MRFLLSGPSTDATGAAQSSDRASPSTSGPFTPTDPRPVSFLSSAFTCTILTTTVSSTSKRSKPSVRPPPSDVLSSLNHLIPSKTYFRWSPPRLVQSSLVGR